VKVCGVDATTLEAIRAACAKAVNFSGDMATFTHQLRFADLRIDNDAIVISTPEIAGLPYVVAGLVAAGGLAAALSTADGLLLAIANALSHDVYYKMVNPNAPTERRLVIARVLLVLVALIAAYVASHRPADIVAMVAWAFSLAAGGLFPALVLGIWWKRTSSAGAVAGMAVGFGVTLLYLVVSRYYPSFGVNYLGMTSLLNPMTGAPIVPNMAGGAGRPERRHARRHRLEGRLVQRQQHLGGPVRPSRRVPDDDRRVAHDKGAVAGDAELHRRDPAAEGPGAHGEKTA
jgi:cation/acetate symporter